MYRKLVLFTIFLILSYGFWLSPDLKQIAAGVAIFLFGMLSLEEGFKTFTGGLLQKLLQKTTNKLWKSLSFGIVTTTLMQSSSMVSVITISFLSAGLISLTSGIGIIYGANLGTTTGAWLIAGYGLKINLSTYAMPLLVFGVILVLQKPRELKGVGYVLAGLGFLFLGIHYMKTGFETFRETIDLQAYAVSGYAGVFLYTLIGILATVIMQSSHATLVLIITALAGQIISYDNALALAIGSNIGTTVTAVLGAISANVSGRRLAAAHVIFNVVTGLVAIAFIHQLMTVVDASAARLGIAANDYTLKLAFFHTLFNLLGIILMLPFTRTLVKLLKKIVPAHKTAIQRPLYLHHSAIELPDTALEAVRKETMNLYDYFFGVICRGLSIRIRDIYSDLSVDEIVKRNNKPIAIDIDAEYTENIKALYAEIVTFISSAQVNMSGEQSNAMFELRTAGRAMLEAVKNTKHLHKNLIRHINDPNPYVRNEYRKIRYRLASILKRLAEIQTDRDEQGTALLALHVLEKEVEDADQRFYTGIDQLIREKHISGKIATSLMNDYTYAKNIAQRLLQIAHILFKSRDKALQETQQSLLLNEQEMADALENRNHSSTESTGKEGEIP